MPDTINGKTPEEVKKGLVCCASKDDCVGVCPYEGINLCRDFLMKHAKCLIEQLESRLAQAERERDAAVADLIDASDCHYCQRKDLPKQCGRGYCSDCDNEKCPCYDCTPKNNNFIWRGVCAENTEGEAE